MLIADEYLDGKVNTYLEQVVGRQFRLKTQAGTALTALTTIEQDSKITTDIVNDGFGINQLVFLLAKILNKGAQTLCIEEPEINLHPGVIRKLPKTFIELVRDEERQVLISTHSETLIISVLSAVARKDILTTDIVFYLTTRTKGVTNFNKQKISESGRVETGLASFITGELDDIKAFFKSTKPTRVKKGATTPNVDSKNEQEFQNYTQNSQ
jgi:predicted ATPase